jgi:CheY-like chemotaxis protein
MTPRSILIADDDDWVRSLLRTTLPAEEFEIVEARDGSEALEIAAGGRALDLVLLDWRMPGASGEDVLRALKGARPDVPVIVLTAETAPSYRRVAETLGVDLFLTKPFSPLQLLDAVERLVGRDA